MKDINIFEHFIRTQILGHNTISLRIHVTDSIRENINNDKINTLVSLDLSKAFDSINHAYELRIFPHLKYCFSFEIILIFVGYVLVTSRIFKKLNSKFSIIL